MTTLCRLAVEQRVKKPKLIMKKITKEKKKTANNENHQDALIKPLRVIHLSSMPKEKKALAIIAIGYEKMC